MAVVVRFCAQVSIVSLLVLLWTTGNNGEFARNIDKKAIGIKREKLTHFKVYWHDVVAGPRPSAITVVPPSNGSKTAFGMVRMIDNCLTEGPDISSKLVGKAQGFYAQAAQDQIGLLMAMNLAFFEGKYNGSTLTVLGRNTVFSEVREMPVVGGSGLFRFARGYVQATTHTFDLTTGDATVEYNIYVLHY